MKKCIIRFWTVCILLVGIIAASVTTVSASSASMFPTVSKSYVIKGYCYRVHDATRKSVNVYYNESCSSRNKNEYVDVRTDECYIVGRSSRNNNVEITYPTKTGRKDRWTSMGVFTSASSYKIRYAKAKISSYKFASTNNGYGSISKNDQVRVYETWKGYVRVLYPISGGFKLAWIREVDANRYLSTSRDTGNYVNISNGTYKIATALNTGYVLDVKNYATSNGGNVEIYPYHNTNNEKWELSSLGNGYYRITDCNSRKVLDVSGGGSASGTNVQIWESNNTNAQKWRFISAGGGYYYIANANGCYLDVQSGTVSNGNNVWVYTLNRSNAQKWKLDRVSVSNNSNNSTNSNITSQVRARLDKIANGTLKYNSSTVLRVGSRFTGTRSGEQCKGYAKNVFYLLFKVTPSSTQNKPYNYLLCSTSGMTKVGSVTSRKDDDIKRLFLKARPGDFVQIRRSHTGSHSAIVYSVTNTGVTFMEANLDNRNTIYKKTYKWSELRSANQAISVYTASNYSLR